MSPPERLSVELERAALSAVRTSYQNLNGTFFRWHLKPPAFEIADSTSWLGRWSPAHRAIELSRELFVRHGWGVLVEVLKHEMAHQYVDEVLGVRDETAHGPAFRRVCEERGFDARAAGAPEARGASDPAGAVLERVQKLLALAESPNEHEAQAAMSAARRLMLKHNLDAVGARRAQGYTYRHLGRPSGRTSEHQRLLALILSEHFFVEVIWVPVWRVLEGKRGSVLEVCGSLDNVELAEYVHSFLAHTAERLWREHKRASGVSNDAGRQSYLAGVMSGFRERLAADARRHRSEGLVWVGDAELHGFLRRRHPQVRMTRHVTGRGTRAYAEGREAGRKIVLHRGIRSGSTAATPPLLPSGGR